MSKIDLTDCGERELILHIDNNLHLDNLMERRIEAGLFDHFMRELDEDFIYTKEQKEQVYERFNDNY